MDDPKALRRYRANLQGEVDGAALYAALAHAESLVSEETLITFHDARGQIVKTSFVGGKREDGKAADPQPSS